jgi:hypothetical protein
VFATVEHTDSTTLYLSFDHSNVDGYSILLIAHEIRELYAAALTGVPAPLTQVGSYLDFADTERGYAARIHREHEAVVRWRDFLTTGGGKLPVFPALSDELSGSSGPSGLSDPAAGSRTRPDAQISGCDWLLDADTAHAFQKACRDNGGNYLTGVLACLALAGRESAGAAEFRALTPFHTRNDSQWVRSVGWYVGVAPLHFPVDGQDTFTELLPAAAAALDGADAMAAIPLPRVSELLGTRLEPRFVVSYMDLRRTPGAREWGAWKAIALRSHSVHPDEVYLWINRSYEGVYLSFRHPRTERARLAVSRFIAETARQMNLVALAAEKAPAPAHLPAPAHVPAPAPAHVSTPAAALEGPRNQEMEPTAC